MAPITQQDLTAEIVDGPVPVVRVRGELDLSTAARMCRVIQAASARRMVIDLRELEFCDSTGLRALMQVLCAGGNEAAAREVYRELRLLLHRELNTAPDPETQALFEQLRAEARGKAVRGGPCAVRGEGRGHLGVAGPDGSGARAGHGCGGGGGAAAV